MAHPGRQAMQVVLRGGGVHGVADIVGGGDSGPAQAPLTEQPLRESWFPLPGQAPFPQDPS